MMRSTWRNSPRLAAWLAAGVGVAVILLTVFGVRASREGQRSSVLLVQRRVDEAARLLVTALARDMRAVQTSVLTSSTWDSPSSEWPHDITALVAGAFARYPYPESFLAWRVDDPASAMIFLTRSSRPPSWIAPKQEPNRHPVREASSEAVSRLLLASILVDAQSRRSWSIREQEIDGVPYQVVVRLRYQDARRQQLAAVYGFMVNLPWVRDYYFSDLTRQMARIHRDEIGLTWGVLDDHGVPVVSTGALPNASPATAEPFALAFFDAALVAVNRPAGLPVRTWSVVVSGASDPALAAATWSAHATLWLVAIAAIILAIGLVLTASAVRARGELAELRAEFMSSVTHELKTPIATIRALGDTLTSGRVPEPVARQEYGGMIVQEANRLARLVDNLLAHARVTDVAEIYSFAAVDADELIQSVLAQSRQRLRHGGFDVVVDLPPDLPLLWADRTAMQLALDNLLDNAIRYSGSQRAVQISARTVRDAVAITIGDRGIGIPPRDLDRVTQKFVRAANVPAGGSGLGLSIVARIVADHGGTMNIDSRLDQGTRVTLLIPVFDKAARRGPSDTRAHPMTQEHA
jgi:signal transduction histidine kinase